MTKEWENIGKKKAKEYSEMKFDKFAEMLIDELKLGISYTPVSYTHLDVYKRQLDDRKNPVDEFEFNVV